MKKIQTGVALLGALLLSFVFSLDAYAATASIKIAGSDIATVAVGQPIPKVTWKGTGGKAKGGYSTTISVNNKDNCKGVTTGTWWQGKTSSGSFTAAPAIWGSTPAPLNLVGCEVTHTYKVTPTKGKVITSSATLKYISPIIVNPF